MSAPVQARAGGSGFPAFKLTGGITGRRGVFRARGRTLAKNNIAYAQRHKYSGGKQQARCNVSALAIHDALPQACNTRLMLFAGADHTLQFWRDKDGCYNYILFYAPLPAIMVNAAPET